MINENSSLRRLPRKLGANQIVFFDALRISAEIANLAYNDLLRNLEILSLKTDRHESTIFVDTVRHSWTFIDSVHRFRIVLQQAPGIKHNHIYKLFMRQTEDVTGMRNNAQHLNQELVGISKRGQGAYGTLTWVLGKGDTDVPQPMILNIGTAYGRIVGPETDFLERLPENQINKIRLELASHYLILSEIYKHLDTMVRSLEATMSDFAKDQNTYNSDQFIKFELKPITEPN